MPITRNAAESRADLNKALIGAAKLRMQPIAPSDVTPHLTPPALIQFPAKIASSTYSGKLFLPTVVSLLVNWSTTSYQVAMALFATHWSPTS